MNPPLNISATSERASLRRRPRILYITPYWPHRATCASELRAVHIARALHEFGDVEMLVVDAEGGESEWAARYDQEFRVAFGVQVHPWPNRDVGMKLNWLFNPRSLYPHGCGVDDAAAKRVREFAADFDLVWFCKLRTPNMFPCWAWKHSVCDIDDVPSTFERSVVQQAHGGREHLLARLRYWSWRRRDQRLDDRFSVLCVCSEPDRQYLKSLGIRVPVKVVPNGYARPSTRTPPRQPANPPRIGFIGIFDYEPNIEGLRWFVRECWPRIKRELPDVRLRLVGRLSDGPLKPDGPDIDGLGWVPDAQAEMATWSAMIVPIRLGAGTRGKIAHAFSAKCPVVSTTLGAHGYEVRHDEELLLGDTAQDFAIGCMRLLREPAAGVALAERAWEVFLEKWTWDAIRPRVWAAAESCLQTKEIGR